MVVLIGFLVAVVGLVPAVSDLADSGSTARKHQLPIVLYVSRSGCPFCRAFEAEVLGPLTKSEVYEGAIFLELEMDGSTTFSGFNHEKQTASDVAAAYSISVTPTILFLAPDGTELVDRIVGYNRNGFYTFYFERAIRQAQLELAKNY
jgi:thioredoxin-related protein